MPPRGHRAQRVAAAIVASSPRPQQQLDRRGLRELRRAAEAAVDGVVARRAIAATAASSSAGLELAPAAGSMRALAAEVLDDPLALLLGSPSRRSSPRLGDRLQQLAPARHAVARLGREVRAGVERHLLGRREGVQRPAAVAGHRLHRVHVDRVDVGPLLAVDLDADEVLVHVARRRPGPRTTRAPSRGTSGRPSSRSRRAAARRARAPRRAPRSPHGCQSTGLSLCWSRYGRGLVGERVGHAARLPAATACAA